MYRILLPVGVLLAAFLAVPSAEASPSTEVVAQQSQKANKPTVKHIKKKKRSKKRLKKVDPPTLQNFVRQHDDSTSAGYWQNELEYKEFLQGKPQVALVSTKVELDMTLDEKRRKLTEGCSWFSCSEQANNVVVAEAKKWVGKHAKRDKAELKKLFAIEWNDPIDPARIPWCAAFANAILRREGYETTHSLAARSFLAWGVGTHNPQDGDIVVLKRGHSKWAGHVGFFQGYAWYDGVQYVKVLGGNTDKEVQIGYFPVSSVLGYRKVA
jgi:uncharacterized protein (TIGR02594 family)